MSFAFRLTDSSKGQYFIKQIIDIGAALFLIVVLSPIMLIIAIAIKLDSKGPAFYKQTRVGKEASLFLMWKFRTMVVEADTIGPGLTEHHDGRITMAGKFLRRLSLDELPQLFNVLRGEMSLVGPRPEIPEIVQTYSKQQQRALSIKPGITGLSQINGRDDLPLDIKLKYEVDYVENCSLALDFEILLKTISVVISGQGNRY